MVYFLANEGKLSNTLPDHELKRFRMQMVIEFGGVASAPDVLPRLCIELTDRQQFCVSQQSFKSLTTSFAIIVLKRVNIFCTIPMGIHGGSCTT